MSCFRRIRLLPLHDPVGREVVFAAGPAAGTVLLILVTLFGCIGGWLLAVAAGIMAVLLLTSSFATAVLIPAREFQPGGGANGRALAGWRGRTR